MGADGRVLLCLFLEGFGELVVDGVLDVEARCGGADLAHVAFAMVSSVHSSHTRKEDTYP